MFFSRAHEFASGSLISEEFAKAPSVQEYVRDSIANWRNQNGGVDMYRNPDRRNFGLGDFSKDAVALNGAAHVIGSFGMAGERRGDRIDWWAENSMGEHSFYAGNALDKLGIPGQTDHPRPGPSGTTHQTILFTTDLDGRPISDAR